MIEVRIKVKFSELSQKAFRKVKQFCKLLSMENSALLKGLTLRAPKSLVFRGCFFAKFTWAIIRHGWADVLRLAVGLTELSEFGCKFEWYFCRSRCNCSCLTFCTDYKYERDRTFGDKLDSDQFRGGNGPSQFVYLLSVML